MTTSRTSLLLCCLLLPTLTADEPPVRAFACPEPGRVARARVRAEYVASGETTGKKALRIGYEFPDRKCRQVVVDLQVRPAECYRKLRFRVKGDGSGNELVVWLGAAGRWYGQGRVRLDFRDRRRIAWDVKGTDTDVVTVLRFCIGQKGGTGRHAILLDDIAFRDPGPPRYTNLHVFGPPVPPAVRRLPSTDRTFRKTLVHNDDRTILLLDGRPVFCVLDVHFDPAYLATARRCGVNAFAIDLYWRNIEPRRGYREWGALREKLAELERLGFGVILLLGPHQPVWWQREHLDLPGADQGQAYALSPAVVRDFGRILREFVRQTRDFRNVLGYAVSAGGEQDTSFPEVAGTPGPGSVWRRDPTCLQHYRQWLRAKYETVAALREAWGDETVSFDTAAPPARLPRNDFRRKWLDWAEFANAWWVRYADWVASIVRPPAPDKLLIARFGWPVFQAENVFLARLADVDLLQCKDAVAAWEVGHPGRQLSRTAMYYGALRRSAKVVFPEMDIIHGRGWHPGDLSRYVPLFARFAGSLWYYRGIRADDPQFVNDLSRAVAEGKRLVRESPGDARIGVFYSVAWANWISLHRDYRNEAALTGAAELLRDLNLRFAITSEFTLSDLFDFNLVVIPYNPAISGTAEQALAAYVRSGGAVIMEANTGQFDLTGARRAGGTLGIAPVQVTSEQTAPQAVRFAISAKGFPPEVRIDSSVLQCVRPAGGSTVIGSQDDAHIVMNGRVLYIPCRFFAPYSYGRNTDRKALRGIVAAFLRRVAPDQERMARKALDAIRDLTEPASACLLKRRAEIAFADDLFVRAAYLSRLAASLAREAPRADRLSGAADILLREHAAWIEAALRRLKRTPHAANAPSPGQAAETTQEAEDALDLARRALSKEADPLRALALLAVSRLRLTDLERRVRTGNQTAGPVSRRRSSRSRSPAKPEAGRGK